MLSVLAVRVLRTLLIVLAATLGVGLLDRFGYSAWLEWSLGSGSIQWLWDEEALGTVRRPARFMATLDVEIDRPAPEARLFLTADGSYFAFVNSHWVGANRFTEGQWDAYAVGAVVREGNNRIEVEVSSPTGTGGLLACLRLGPDEPCRVISGSDWRIGRYRDIEGRGRAPIEVASAVPVTWRPTPFGRWRPPTRVESRPLVSSCFDTTRRIAAYRTVEEGDKNVPVRRLWWRQTRHGIVVVRLEGRTAQNGTLLFGPRGDEPAPPENALPIVTSPGQRIFRVIEPRALRYLTVVGAPEVQEAWIFPRRPDCAGYTVSPAAGPALPLFGIPLPQ